MICIISNKWVLIHSVKMNKKAIALPISLTKQRDGTVKSSKCTWGQKPQVYKPAIMIESIFITAAIDPEEEQDKVIIDLLGAFLHAQNNEKVIMFIEGKLAKLMVHLAPQSYYKYIITIKIGKKICKLESKRHYAE